MIIVVRKCSPECPFHIMEGDVMVCNVSTPSKRPIPKMEDKFPSFCPLRREQTIVRRFEEE